MTPIQAIEPQLVESFSAPVQILTHPVSPWAVKVYLYLSSLAGGNFPSSRDLSAVLGMSRKRLEDSIKELTANNMLRFERTQIKGLIVRRVFEVLSPTVWRAVETPKNPAPVEISVPETDEKLQKKFNWP